MDPGSGVEASDTGTGGSGLALMDLVVGTGGPNPSTGVLGLASMDPGLADGDLVLNAGTQEPTLGFLCSSI